MIYRFDQNLYDPVTTQTYTKFLIIFVGRVIGNQRRFLLKNDHLRFSECITFQTAATDGSCQRTVFCDQHSGSRSAIS